MCIVWKLALPETINMFHRLPNQGPAVWTTNPLQMKQLQIQKFLAVPRYFCRRREWQLSARSERECYNQQILGRHRKRELGGIYGPVNISKPLPSSSRLVWTWNVRVYCFLLHFLVDHGMCIALCMLGRCHKIILQSVDAFLKDTLEACFKILQSLRRNVAQ